MYFCSISNFNFKRLDHQNKSINVRNNNNNGSSSNNIAELPF